MEALQPNFIATIRAKSLEEFGDLIGETINDDLVQAIQNTELSGASPASGDDEIDESSADTVESSAEAADAPLDEVESSGGQQEE